MESDPVLVLVKERRTGEKKRGKKEERRQGHYGLFTYVLDH